MKGQEALFSSDGSDYVLPFEVSAALHEEFKFTRTIGGVSAKMKLPHITSAKALGESWGRAGEAVIVNPKRYGS